MKKTLPITVACLLACALPGTFVLHAQEFIVTYGGQVSRTLNWSNGTRDRITLNAAGTVRVRPHQMTTSDGQTFLSYTADLDTTNHVWGTAIEDGSVPTYVLNFDATRLVSRSPSSTYSHFTNQTASYLYFETEDSVYAPPDDITVYAWEYVSNQQMLRLWVALSDPFYYPDASYEHYDFPAAQVVTGQSSAHSCLLGTAVDSEGVAVSGAQVVFGGVTRTTDAQGTFQYDDIPPANYLLTITKSGYNSFTNVETIPSFSILHRSYTLERPALTLTMHRAEGLAIANGGADAGIDAPLVLNSDANSLGASSITPIGMGLVADGVTPLLIKLTENNPTTAPSTYRITLPEPTGGSVAGGLGPHLRVLQGGAFVAADSSGTVTMSIPNHSSSTACAFAYVSGIRAEDLTSPAGLQEFSCNLSAQPIDGSGNPIGSTATLSFKIRHPPIVLIHGIADDASTWSSAFTSALAQYRPADFIRAISYDVGVGPIKNAWPNAWERFDILSMILDQTLTEQFEGPIKANWAFTRYDVVGHSQGGVLARMLCQVDHAGRGAFTAMGDPVVSEANFHRGRFRRVITVGSPHNGTLIAWYALKLVESGDPVDRTLASAIVSKLAEGVASFLASKFDPFDPQIAEINSDQFPVDSRIGFNCVRTAIAGGAPPSLLPQDNPPCYDLLGLFLPTGFSGESRGQVLLPDGSDGVVDFASEGGGAGTLVTDVRDTDIAHADMPLNLFGVPGGHSQTTYSGVASAIGLLLNGPRSSFGPFRLPRLLTEADEKRYEDSLILGNIVVDLILILPRALDVSTNVDLRLQAPADLPPYGPITWYAWVYGTNGLAKNGLTLLVSTNDSAQAALSVESTVEGQVVAGASYFATNGVWVLAKPVLVTSHSRGATLSAIELDPPTAVLSVKDSISTSIWGRYTNGLRCLLYIPTGEATYSSSDTNIASVDINGTVTLSSFGQAVITATYKGLTAQTTISSEPPRIGILFAITPTNGGFALGLITSAGTTNVVQASTNLVNWVDVQSIYSSNGFIRFEDNVNLPVRFYRVLQR